MDAPVAKLHDALAIQLPSNSHNKAKEIIDIMRKNPFQIPPT